MGWKGLEIGCQLWYAFLENAKVDVLSEMVRMSIWCPQMSRFSWQANHRNSLQSYMSCCVIICNSGTPYTYTLYMYCTVREKRPFHLQWQSPIVTNWCVSFNIHSIIIFSTLFFTVNELAVKTFAYQSS